MVVAGVADEIGAVVFVSNVEGISTEHVEEIREDVSGVVGDVCRFDGGRAKETVAVETGEDFAGITEEGGKVEGEVVWFVAWACENVSLDLEVSAPNLDEDFGFKELGD